MNYKELRKYTATIDCACVSVISYTHQILQAISSGIEGAPPGFDQAMSDCWSRLEEVSALLRGKTVGTTTIKTLGVHSSGITAVVMGTACLDDMTDDFYSMLDAAIGLVTNAEVVQLPESSERRRTWRRLADALGELSDIIVHSVKSLTSANERSIELTSKFDDVLFRGIRGRAAA